MADLNQTTISDTGFIKAPVGTQGQRTADSAGKMRFNSTKGILEWHNSQGWTNRGDWVITPNYRDAPSYTPHVLIQVESQGLNNTSGAGRRQFVQIDGTTVVNADAPRSYRITKLRQDANTGFCTYVSSNGYDVNVNASGEAAAAAAYLEGFVDGELMILNTYDEPNRNSGAVTEQLITKFGSKLGTYRSQFTSRDTRLVVSICGSTIPLFEEHKPSPEPGTFMSMWIP